MTTACPNGTSRDGGDIRTRIARQLSTIPAQATAALIVRLGAIRRNYRQLRERAAGAETAAVVKANAYGLGAGRCVPALAMEGCRTFFVATFAEAEALRALSPYPAIYVLDGLLPENAALYEELCVRPVLGSAGRGVGVGSLLPKPGEEIARGNPSRYRHGTPWSEAPRSTATCAGIGARSPLSSCASSSRIWPAATMPGAR